MYKSFWNGTLNAPRFLQSDAGARIVFVARCSKSRLVRPREGREDHRAGIDGWDVIGSSMRQMGREQLFHAPLPLQNPPPAPCCMCRVDFLVDALHRHRWRAVLLVALPIRVLACSPAVRGSLAARAALQTHALFATMGAALRTLRHRRGRAAGARSQPRPPFPAAPATSAPLGPLGFDFAQHRQTLRPTVDGDPHCPLKLDCKNGTDQAASYTPFSQPELHPPCAGVLAVLWVGCERLTGPGSSVPPPLRKVLGLERNQPSGHNLWQRELCAGALAIWWGQAGEAPGARIERSSLQVQSRCGGNELRTGMGAREGGGSGGTQGTPPEGGGDGGDAMKEMCATKSWPTPSTWRLRRQAHPSCRTNLFFLLLMDPE